MFELTDIEKSYPDKTVLSNLNLKILYGEIISIVGRTASGKSTLLKILAGLIKPDVGSVRQSEKIFRPAIVFQDYKASLYPWLTAYQNIAIARDSKNNEDEIKECLSLVGLEKCANDYPDNMSGGQNQRLALARAIYFQPNLLLLDEPFASVDAVAKCDLQDCLLHILKLKDVSCILVTHDVEEALYVGDKVYLMDKGKKNIVLVSPKRVEPMSQNQNIKLDPRFIKMRREITERLMASSE